MILDCRIEKHLTANSANLSELIFMKNKISAIRIIREISGSEIQRSSSLNNSSILLT